MQVEAAGADARLSGTLSQPKFVVEAGSSDQGNDPAGQIGDDSTEKKGTMTPLYHDPHFTFRFADNRIIPRFHLEGIEAGRRVSVFKIDPGTGERLDLLATATVGEGGWVDLSEPIIVRSGEAFIAAPKPGKSP